jgi:hypothetical protein
LSGQQKATVVARGPNGEVAVAGTNQGTIKIGDNTMVCTGDYDGFIGVFDASGTPKWSKAFGDPVGLQQVWGMSFDSLGNLYIGGAMTGDANFGGGQRNSSGSYDAYLAKYDTDGHHVWSNLYGDSDSQGIFALAIDALDNIHVVGAFSGGINFGGQDLMSQGDNDIFVAKLDSNGSHLWSHAYGGSGYEAGTGVAVDAASNVYMVGELDTTANWPCA